MELEPEEQYNEPRPKILMSGDVHGIRFPGLMACVEIGRRAVPSGNSRLFLRVPVDNPVDSLRQAAELGIIFFAASRFVSGR
jgi:hypothetical protein